MTEEQTPKCPLCKSEMSDRRWTGPYYCANDDCAMYLDRLSLEAIDALNARLAEAERSNSESIDPARLQIVEKKVAQLKERGFRFAGYIMSDDIRRCTVDKWGRVEWPDSQSHAEAVRLRNGLYEFLGDLPRVDTDGTSVITVRAVIKRVQAILDSAEAADEAGDEG